MGNEIGISTLNTDTQSKILQTHWLDRRTQPVGAAVVEGFKAAHFCAVRIFQALHALSMEILVVFLVIGELHRFAIHSDSLLARQGAVPTFGETFVWEIKVKKVGATPWSQRTICSRLDLAHCGMLSWITGVFVVREKNVATQ